MGPGGGRRHGAFVRRLGRRVLLVGVAVGLLGALAVPWLRPPTVDVPDRGVELTRVTVVNPGLGRETGRRIVVRGARIARLEASGDAAPTRYSGSFVLPGLIDMHVHYGADQRELFGLLFLTHGVTTVRDTGDLTGTVADTRRLVRDGEVAGPTVVSCGPILDGDPPTWPGARVVRDRDDARAAVEEASAAGAECLKVYDDLGPDALAGVREAAAARHLRVIGHVPHGVTLEDAGLADVQHLTGVPEPMFTDTSFRAWVESWLDLPEARVAAVAETSRRLGIAHTPTLVMWERLSRLFGDEVDAPADVALLPRYYRDVVWNPQAGLPFVRELRPEVTTTLARALPVMLRVVGRLHAAGVRIHAGTDVPSPLVVPGASMHEELRLLVAAGLGIEDAWAAATRVAGESLGVPGLGVVRAGAPADLLLFRDDPTVDLRALSTLRAVVARGRLYPRADLEAAIAAHRALHASVLYDTVVTALARPLLRWRFGGRPAGR
jgi:imidazolonepropionase-like amidohydrolase